MPTKKSKNIKATMNVTRDTVKVTQYPADTSGSTVSQLTRIETPMRKLVGKVKSKGKSGTGYNRIDF